MEPLNQEQNSNKSVEQEPIKSPKKRYAGIFLLILILIVGVGVWKMSQKPTQIENAEVSDSDFILYANERLGFSILLPKYSEVWTYDNSNPNGKYAVLPVETFDDKEGNFIYVGTSYPEANKLKFVFEKIINDADLIKFGRREFGDGCVVINKIPASQPGIFDLEFESTTEDVNKGNDTCGFGYSKNIVKYSLGLKQLVFWGMGQDYNFTLGSKVGQNGLLDHSSVKIFDQTMIGSFKFLYEDTIDISKWNLYEDDEYGFEIKYPTEWLVRDVPKDWDQVVFSNISLASEVSDQSLANESAFVINKSKISNPKNLNADSFVEEKWKGIEAEILYRRNSFIDNKEAVCIIAFETFGKHLICDLVKNNKEISFDFPVYQEKFIEIYQTILSTFKFTK